MSDLEQVMSGALDAVLDGAVGALAASILDTGPEVPRDEMQVALSSVLAARSAPVAVAA